MDSIKISFLLFIGISVSTYSCHSTHKENEHLMDQDASAQTDGNTESSELEPEFFDFSLPSPFHVALLFDRYEIPFEQGLTNSLLNSAEYLSNTQKKLNFGIYSADLSYYVLHQEKQQALTYIETIHAMARDLGFSSIFNSEELLQRFEDNIEDQDALGDILLEIEYKLSGYNEENDRLEDHLVIFTGAWVESMYLGSSVLKKRENEGISSRLVEQMYLLNNLIEGLNIFAQKDEKIQIISAQLSDLKKTYEELPLIKKALKENDGFIDYETIRFKRENVISLAQKLEIIRENIIKT